MTHDKTTNVRMDTAAVREICHHSLLANEELTIEVKTRQGVKMLRIIFDTDVVSMETNL